MKSFHTFCVKFAPKVQNTKTFSIFALAKITPVFRWYLVEKRQNRGLLVLTSDFFCSFRNFSLKMFGGFRYKAYLCGILKYNRMNYETNFINKRKIFGAILWCGNRKRTNALIICIGHLRCAPLLNPIKYNHYVSKSKL